MIEQIGERKSRFVAGGFQPVVELFAKRGMERTVDEVVGLLDPDLPARLGEIARAQVGPRGGWPCCQFHVEQFRRPAAPGQGPPADGEDQARHS